MTSLHLGSAPPPAAEPALGPPPFPSVAGCGGADYAGIIEIDREILRRGRLADFVKLVWPLVVPQPLVWSWHLDIMCSILEGITRGDLLKVIFNVPPGSSKSLIVAVFWPAWERLTRPAEGWLVASFDHSLVRNHSTKVLRILQSDWLAQRCPDIDLGLPQSVNAVEWFTQQGGFHFSTSIDGKGTGRHGTRRVIDDPTKPKDVNSDQLRKAIDWYSTTWKSRKASATTPEVVVMQRLAEEDLTGYLLDTDGELTDDNPDGWLLVSLPLEFDPQRAFRSRWGSDPRTYKGELLSPRNTPQEVSSLRRTLGPTTYSAQYDQQPLPAGGQILKREWFRRWAPSDSDLLRDLGTLPMPHIFERTMISCDLTFGASEGSADVALVVFGTVGVQAFVLEASSERLDFVESISAILSLRRRYPGATILVENKANGPALMTTLKNRVPGIVPEEPHGSKVARMIAISGYVEAGNVALPHERSGAEWLPEFDRQVLRFPRSIKKDLADAFSQGVRYLFANDASAAADAAAAITEPEQWVFI